MWVTGSTQSEMIESARCDRSINGTFCAVRPNRLESSSVQRKNKVDVRYSPGASDEMRQLLVSTNGVSKSSDSGRRRCGRDKVI